MKILVSLTLVVTFFFANLTAACTTFFLTNSAQRVVGKNMDWPYGQGIVYVNKRDVAKRAVFVTDPLTWTSKYMSLTFSQTGREFPWEGMNEAGLSVNIMQLFGSVVPPSTDPRPAVNVLQWIQFILDTSANVDQAAVNAERIRISGPMVTTIHYMVCDRYASCAIFENLNGQLVIHRDADMPYKALTNNTYQESVGHLDSELASENPKAIVSSTNTSSLARFDRAALLASAFQSYQEPIAYAFNVLQNVRNPSYTQWTMVFSLASGQIDFKTTQSPAVKTFNLKSFDPHCSAPVKIFDMNSTLSGDITDSFADYSSVVNARLVQMSRMGKAEPALAQYPETTRCLESEGNAPLF